MTNQQLEELAKDVLDSNKWMISLVTSYSPTYQGNVSGFEDAARNLAHAVLQYLGKEEENVPGR